MNTVRRIIMMIASVLMLGGVVIPASAEETTLTNRTTYAFLNCNWQGYTAGQKLDGVDLTWATGSGSTRKYIRAKRTADLLKNDVRSSIYALTECDTEMLADLAKLMGTQWKYVGGQNDGHNRNGWLYDANKWYPGNLAVMALPGDPDGGYTGRRLLQVGFFRKVTGNPMLSVATTHYSSGNAEARDLQSTATLDKIGGANRLLSADTNASSYPKAGTNVWSATGPRWEMAQRGWSDPFAGMGGFNDYNRLPKSLAVDIISVSPNAQKTGKIKFTNPTTVDASRTYVSDHDVLKGTVEF